MKEGGFGPALAGDFARDSAEAFPHAAGVNRLCIFLGTTVGGYGGWYLGDVLGLGFGWSFVISSVGSIVGVWAGWKLAQRFQ